MIEDGPPRTASARLEASRAAERRRLGGAIRRVRRQRGLTLAEVAERAQVSISLLSQVERGRVDPSLDSLRGIADALDTSPFSLLSDRTHRSAVVRVGEGRNVDLPAGEGLLEILTAWRDAAFEVARWTLEPGGATQARRRGHEGEESVLILEGSARVEVGEDVYDLLPGDMVSYDSGLPHRVVAPSHGRVVFICISAPPF